MIPFEQRAVGFRVSRARGISAVGTIDHEAGKLTSRPGSAARSSSATPCSRFPTPASSRAASPRSPSRAGLRSRRPPSRSPSRSRNKPSAHRAATGFRKPLSASYPPGVNARPTIYDVARLAGRLDRDRLARPQRHGADRSRDARDDRGGRRAARLRAEHGRAQPRHEVDADDRAAPARHREPVLRRAGQRDPARALEPGTRCSSARPRATRSARSSTSTCCAPSRSTASSSTGSCLPPDRIARFVRNGLPIVCLDRDVDSASVPLVQVDNRLGARMATEHLLSLGHRRIAHVAGAPELRISEERIAGYSEALLDAGIRPDRALLAVGSLHRGGRVRGGEGAARARPSSPRCSPPTTSPRSAS